MRMFKNVYGLDLGTYEIKIYDKRRDRIRRTKNVIAIQDEKEIFAIGNEAYTMYEKAPENIQVLFPMHNGVIARFDEMQYLLHAVLKREGMRLNGAEYVIAVPTDVTEVQKKAFYDLVCHSAARAKKVRIVERAIADALGMGIDVFKAKGLFFANLGAETTELSVLSRGGLIMSRLLPVGGRNLDDAVTASVRHNKEFLIGRMTAEQLRCRSGVLGKANPKRLAAAGRDLTVGMPGTEAISVGLIRAVSRNFLSDIVREIENMMDRNTSGYKAGDYKERNLSHRRSGCFTRSFGVLDGVYGASCHGG